MFLFETAFARNKKGVLLWRKKELLGPKIKTSYDTESEAWYAAEGTSKYFGLPLLRSLRHNLPVKGISDIEILSMLSGD